LKAIDQGAVLSTGPHGETATPPGDVSLSPSEVAKVQAKHATAAIVMHEPADWSTAQVAGLKNEFGKLGIKVLAVTDANFKPDKQVSDLQTVEALHPDIIVSIPVDPVAEASAYQAAARQGIHLVFMDNVPNGMTAGKDYVSVVSADNYGNGVAAAHEMAIALGGKGEIATVYYNADFFVTNQRWHGFTDTIKKDYPDIKIVEQKGIVGPDFAGNAQAATNAILAQHPTINGVWANWSQLADGVLAAARSAGRTNLIISTEDLDKDMALSLAQNGMIKGLGAQVPFDQGVTEAMLGGYSLIGKKAPAYVALHALPVSHSNVLQAWQEVFHQPPTSELTGAYAK
jgi:ribose transport system substrate-binding protein